MAWRNIVFDLGGVVFARDKRDCSDELLSFFSFVSKTGTPLFWDEYDRGTLSFDEVKAEICRFRNCDLATCERMLGEAIGKQGEIPATKKLIAQLKDAGFRLYVLSNMSREFIDFLRRLPVYGYFDGEVVSCEINVIKPEPQIYRHLLDKFALDPSETIFIDDRAANLEAAKAFGIATCLFDSCDPEKSCDELRRMLEIAG